MSTHSMKVPLASLWHCSSKPVKWLLYEAFFPLVKVNVGPVLVRLSSAFPVDSDLARAEEPWTGLLDCMCLEIFLFI